MGILEDIDKLELSDEKKDELKQSAQAEIRIERRKSRKSDVEQEIKDLGTLFSDQDGNVDPKALGALKLARRVFLSDDEEPGLVLLTDDELELSDDQRTDSRHRDEVTTAGVLRQFISLLPKTDDGRITLSDLVPDSNDDDRPQNVSTGGKDTEGARERLGKITGNTKKRDRKRYNGAVGGAA